MARTRRPNTPDPEWTASWVARSRTWEACPSLVRRTFCPQFRDEPRDTFAAARAVDLCPARVDASAARAAAAAVFRRVDAPRADGFTVTVFARALADVTVFAIADRFGLSVFGILDVFGCDARAFVVFGRVTFARFGRPGRVVFGRFFLTAGWRPFNAAEIFFFVAADSGCPLCGCFFPFAAFDSFARVAADTTRFFRPTIR